MYATYAEAQFSAAAAADDDDDDDNDGSGGGGDGGFVHSGISALLMFKGETGFRTT